MKLTKEQYEQIGRECGWGEKYAEAHGSQAYEAVCRAVPQYEATEPGAPLTDEEKSDIWGSTPCKSGVKCLYDAWKYIDAVYAKRNVRKPEPDYERCIHCGCPISVGAEGGWVHEDSDQTMCDEPEPSYAPPAGWVSLDAVREAVISVVQGDHYQRNGVHARSLADDVCTDLTPRPPTLQERIEKRFYNELRKPGTGLDLDVLAAVAVEECQKESQ